MRGRLRVETMFSQNTAFGVKRLEAELSEGAGTGAETGELVVERLQSDRAVSREIFSEQILDISVSAIRQKNVGQENEEWGWSSSFFSPTFFRLMTETTTEYTSSPTVATHAFLKYGGIVSPLAALY